MPRTLASQIKKMGPGDHLCLIYDTPGEQMAAIIPFFQQGIERNEFCVYISDDLTQDEIHRAFETAGIDLQAWIDRGAFLFATKREAYLKSGTFDPHAMLEFLKSATEKAADDGFSAIRITGEMTWALGDECGCDRLIEYESLVNDYFPGSKALAICQYSRSRFRPEIIRDVLRTHPIAIIGDQVCPNLFYDSPGMVPTEKSTNDRVDWMIAQLKKFRTNEQELQSLLESKEELVEQLQSQNAALQEAEKAMQETIRIREEFLSIASHELKTPLTSLKLQVQMLTRRMEHNDSDLVERAPVSRLIQTANRQLDRLTGLVDDMLDISRIENGKFHLVKEDVDLGQLVRDVVDRHAEQLAAAGCKVRILTESEIIGRWDPFRLEQVLINLLTNAMKYGAGRPIEISVTADGLAQLVVKDNGLGIAEHDRDRIFQRFERAISANNISGLGLGLYITKQIVDNHGGAIQVQSELGRGSEFRVELPLKDAETIFSERIYPAVS